VNSVVFLDRDNTLIANDGDLGDPAGVVLLDGVPEGLARLRDAGYLLVVVTNQGSVARGVCTEEDVDSVHRTISDLVDRQSQRRNLIDRFYYCPFHPDGVVEAFRREHPWRKPQPGMLLQAARDLNLDLASSWMIGDQDRDIEAGNAVGCRTVRIGDVAGTGDTVRAFAVSPSFSEAVDVVLANTKTGGRSLRAGSGHTNDLAPLQRAVMDLSDNIRGQERNGGSNRGIAITCLLISPIPVVLGLLTLPNLESFIAWSIGTLILLLAAISLMLVDQT